MDSKIWAVFHSAWGMDRGEGARSDNYNKKAWVYVQSKLEEYFEKQKEKNTPKN